MMTLFELRKSMEMNKRRNISAASIAQRVGVSRQQYRRYELGESVPDLLIASKLAMVLNLSLSDLVGIIRATIGKEDDPTPPSLN